MKENQISCSDVTYVNSSSDNIQRRKKHRQNAKRSFAPLDNTDHHNQRAATPGGSLWTRRIRDDDGGSAVHPPPAPDRWRRPAERRPGGEMLRAVSWRPSRASICGPHPADAARGAAAARPPRASTPLLATRSHFDWLDRRVVDWQGFANECEKMNRCIHRKTFFFLV